ncbi:LppA family lipoprotein [Mycoplasma mycoides]|uniref:Lipoprotein A n=1 Tax=Mycoplasma mycoides subsp. capri TaxID=40477 RepID=Q9RQS5_MYCMC|nr:LppA family lipoprotein [Mycoplasma mycoides]AAF06071.1 lipoprotein A precursor [Mycoplasma mycoides subsp. capri]EXU60036.1 Hypothetical protein, predicted lipoprotein [Mycoplasma mycoides subsp. capri PG3]QVK04436.1 LppA family lipoprotein [Mycoplasma mycoides subsp. capri]
MKKATKLLLSILPISSISFLSVVSCSTTNSSEKQPKKPSENTPKTPLKPDDIKPNNNDDNSNNNFNPDHKKPDSTNPSENKDPSEPEEKQPDIKPQGDNPNNVQPHNDQPEINNVDLSDLDKIKKELSFDNYLIYKQKDPISAWSMLKNDLSTITTVFYNTNKNVKREYKLSLESPNKDPDFISKKGVIDKVKIKFTKENNFRILEFSFTGFKVTEIDKNKNKKYDYIKPKETVDSRLSGLYPSILAYMLLYAENTNNYKSLQETDKDAINFEGLINKPTNLFNDKFVGFSVGTKELLFDFNENYRKLYVYKLVGAGFDDINGTLTLKVEINNSEDNKEKEPGISKEFSFKEFRKVNTDDPSKNPFYVSLTPADLKKIITDKSIKKNLEDLHLDITKENNLLDFGIDSRGIWGDQILKHLTISLTDNDNHIYDSKETLTFRKSKNSDYKFILGLKHNMSLYPFNTMINNDSIKNILLSVKDKKITLDFELEVPVFATGLSDLTSFSSYNTKTLKLKISSTTSI